METLAFARENLQRRRSVDFAVRETTICADSLPHCPNGLVLPRRVASRHLESVIAAARRPPFRYFSSLLPDCTNILWTSLSQPGLQYACLRDVKKLKQSTKLANSSG
jgi:hypothetical protein